MDIAVAARRSASWTISAVVLAAALAAGEPTQLRDCRTAVEAIHHDAQALEAAFYRTFHGQGSEDLICISAQKAVFGKDLHLELLRSPALGVWTQALAPAVNRGLHGVDATGLAWEGDERRTTAKGEVTVSLERGGNWDGDPLVQTQLGALARVRLGLTVTVRIAEGTVTGEYALKPLPFVVPEGQTAPTNPVPAIKGFLVGSARRLDQPRQVEKDRGGPRSADAIEELHGVAAALEGYADEWYQLIRALAVSRASKRPFLECRKEAIRPCIARPGPRQDKDQDQAMPGADVSTGDEDEVEVVADVGRKDAKGKGSQAAAETLAMVRSIRGRVARLRTLVESWEKGPPPASIIQDTLSTEDPEFGPWYGDRFLPAKDGVIRLPAEIGGPGAQEWQAVIDWQCLGPFPLSPFAASIPGLPDMVWGGDERCVVQTDRVEANFNGKNPTAWESGKNCGVSKDLSRGVFGYVMAPRCFKGSPYSSRLPPMLGIRVYQNAAAGHGGLSHSTFYARCTIESPKALELWSGLGVNRQGRLWVNDCLVWQGPAQPIAGAAEHVTLVRLPLRKGLNHLVLRVDVDRASPFWWLRLCLRGEPRPAAEVKAKAEAVAALRQQFKPDPAVGWRADGTGTALPGCNPPVVWNQKTKQNVLWSVPMPYIGSGNAVPAPGSNRLFVGLDPHWLLCLDKDTGKELWRRPVTVIDLLDDAERSNGNALVEDWWQAMLDRCALPLAKVGGNYFTGFPKWLHYQAYWAEETGIWTPARGPIDDERKGASPELIALLDKRDELQKAADPVSVQEELNKVLKAIEKEQAKTGANDPDSRQAKDERGGKALRAMVSFLSAHGGTGWSTGYWPDYAPWMYPTPVTDGKHVWVKSGFDAAACFDMDGKEIWKKALGGSGGADGMLSSPRLVDGKLVMQILNRKGDAGGIRLIALDAATGARVWETPGLDDYNWNAATPAVLRLTDGRETMSVLVTPESAVIRVDDGKVLVRDCGSQCNFDSPLVVDGDTVVFGAGGLTRVQFIMKSRDQVGCRRLWAQRGGLNCGGAVADDGRVYFTGGPDKDAQRFQEPGTVSLLPPPGGSECWKTMVAHDLTSGRPVAQLLALRKGGNQYSPGSVSDRHVYQIDGDHIFVGSLPKAPHDMVVLTRGEHPLRLANNPIDRTYGSGIIEGDRIYIRGYHYVTCIGYTGDEGRRYQARTVARNLMDEVYAERPGESPIVTVPMVGASTINHYTYQHPRNIYRSAGHCVLTSGYAPHRYWILGPLPRGQAAAVLAASGGPTKPVAGDEVVNVDGQQYGWGPLYQTYLKVAGFKSWELDPINFADIHRLRQVINLNPVLGGQQGAVTVFLFTDLESKVEQTLRFEQTEPGIRAWVGGTEVRHGERIRFAKGFCRLFLEITADTPVAQGPLVSPRFWTSEDPRQEALDWATAVKRRRPYLDEVIRLDADSPEADRARRMLAGLP